MSSQKQKEKDEYEKKLQEEKKVRFELESQLAHERKLKQELEERTSKVLANNTNTNNANSNINSKSSFSNESKLINDSNILSMKSSYSNSLINGLVFCFHIEWKIRIDMKCLFIQFFFSNSVECCTEYCRKRLKEYENENRLLTEDCLKKQERLVMLECELKTLNKYKDTENRIDTLMCALNLMEDKNASLQESLTAETRFKLDLFSALGETRRQLEAVSRNFRLIFFFFSKQFVYVIFHNFKNNWI